MVLDTGAVIVEFQDIPHPLYILIPLAGPKIKKTVLDLSQNLFLG